MILRFDDTNP